MRWLLTQGGQRLEPGDAGGEEVLPPGGDHELLAERDRPIRLAGPVQGVHTLAVVLADDRIGAVGSFAGNGVVSLDRRLGPARIICLH